MHRCMLISHRVRQTLRPSGTPRWRDYLPAFTRNQVIRPFPARCRFMVAQRRYPIAPVLAGRLLATSGDVRLGRTGELHPGAPSVAQRAQLRALRFSVCSVEDRRSSTCWIGDPACLSAVCLQLAVCPETPSDQALWADRHGMRSQSTCVGCSRVSCEV